MSRAGLACIFLLALASVLPGAPADVLLVGADDATLRPLLQQLSGLEVETRGAWTLWRGQLRGKTAVLARSEGDPLNAVAATTLALRLHPPRLVIVFGGSRAHDPGLRPGDLVVSERFVAFDGMISAPAALGAGSDALKWSKRPHPLMTSGERETPTVFFPADAAGLSLARTLTTPHGRVLAGVLGSAHQINREADRVAKLRELWQTSTEDGESGHVAGVAALLKVPVLGFRIVDGPAADAADFTLRFLDQWK